MKPFTAVIAVVTVVTCVGTPAWAQSASAVPGTMGGANNRTHVGQDTLSQDQFNKLTDYADQAKRLTKEDKAKGKTLQDLMAEDKTAAIALTKTMPLNCEIVDAMLVAQGPETVDGKSVNTKTYESACTNGLGYFLVSQEPGRPYGFSCFASDATRAADIKAGRKPGAVCQLPQNADMKAMAAAILSKAGTNCAVRDYRWVGQNSANHTEFDEIACEGGQGYMIVTALPGAQIPVHVETCNQSAARGLPCKLSDNGALPVTLQTFRDSLKQHNVTCDATDQTMRVIGQENAKKRYVVEFQCLQQPKGLVAFIPLNGSTAPFETADCAAAAKRGATCALTK